MSEQAQREKRERYEDRDLKTKQNKKHNAGQRERKREGECKRKDITNGVPLGNSAANERANQERVMCGDTAA